MRFNLVHKLQSAASTGRKFVVLLCLLLVNSFFIRAHESEIVRVDERTYDVRIFFRFDNATLHADYLNNAQTLERLDSILTTYGIESLDSVKVIAYSSPEGAYQYNVALSKRRAQSMRRYLAAAYPDLESKLIVSSGDESWHDLRALIASDRRLGESSRKAMLDIIDSPASPDIKEQRLRSLEAYRYLYSSYFKKLRYAAFRLVFPVGTPIIPGIPDIYGLDDDDLYNIPDEPLVGPGLTGYKRYAALADSTAHAGRANPADSIAAANNVNPADSSRVSGDRTTAYNFTVLEDGVKLDTTFNNPPRYHWPLFAVSTNVIYDLAFVADYLYFTPNFAIEVPIGQKWSVLGEYTFPWWLSDANDKAWEVLKWDIGVRRWLSPHNPAHRMDVLSGHFAGIDLSAGYYDVEPLHNGYQGEFQSVGLEYGYAWKLNEFWRLDASLGIGWMGTHFRYYEADATDAHLVYQHNGKLNVFGPTKANVSFKYIFSRSGKYRRAVR